MDERIQKIRDEFDDAKASIKRRRECLILSEKEYARYIAGIESLEAQVNGPQKEAPASSLGEYEGFHTIFLAEISLSTLHKTMDNVRISSATRMALFQLFHLISYNFLPRQNSFRPSTIGNVPTPVPFSLVYDNATPLRNDLSRAFYIDTGELIVRLGEGLWYLYTECLAPGMQNYTQFRSLIDFAISTTVNIGNFMFLYPRRRKDVYVVLEYMSRLVRHLNHAYCDFRERNIALDEPALINAVTLIHSDDDIAELLDTMIADVGVQITQEPDKGDDGFPFGLELKDSDVVAEALSSVGVPVIRGLSIDIDTTRRSTCKGSFGAVYQVAVKDFGGLPPIHGNERNIVCEKFAVKVPNPVLPRSKGNNMSRIIKQTNKRTFREGRIWKLAGKHDNILPLFFCLPDIPDCKFPALVSPWCNGGNLLNYVNGDANPSILARVTLSLQVARGLAHLHRLRIPGPVIHGDLKSDNILIHNGNAMISDFGLSAIKFDDEDLSTRLQGNDRWLAPEIREAKRLRRSPRTVLTTWSDVFSFGRVFLEALTGCIPFLGFCVAELDLLWDDGKFNEARPEDILDEHWLFMLRCWDKGLEKCRPTAEEAVEFLEVSQARLAGNKNWHHSIYTHGTFVGSSSVEYSSSSASS